MKSILQEAQDIVDGARQQEYGAPEDCFRLIAELWNSYIGGGGRSVNLTGQDVAMMMVLLKVARGQGAAITKSVKRDTWVDIAGYAACGERLGVSQAPAPSTSMEVPVPPGGHELIPSGDFACQGHAVFASGYWGVYQGMPLRMVTDGRAEDKGLGVFARPQRLK